jgi:hypothetical protein
MQNVHQAVTPTDGPTEICVPALSLAQRIPALSITVNFKHCPGP